MESNTPKNLRYTLSLLILITLGLTFACGSEKMRIENIPIYPTAVEGVSPSYSTQVRTAENLQVIDIKKRFGEFDSKAYMLPQLIGWEEIIQFYDNELSKKGFIRKSKIPTNTIDSIIYYEQDGFFSDQKAAISLVETYNDESEHRQRFLLLYVSK